MCCSTTLNPAVLFCVSIEFRSTALPSKRNGMEFNVAKKSLKGFGWQCFFFFFSSFLLFSLAHWITKPHEYRDIPLNLDDRRGPSENSDSCQIRAMNKQTKKHACTFWIQWYFWRDLCVHWLLCSSHLTLSMWIWSQSLIIPENPKYLGQLSVTFLDLFLNVFVA